MEIEQYISKKKAFVFKFDDVLFPQKDYLLQVYYLFAEFMSYTEQLDASKIITFMQEDYLLKGSENLFDRTAAHFQIPQPYKDNFLLLHQNARLPLKLLLFKQSLKLLQDIAAENKLIFLLVDGDPIQQLNKIKQTEWNGLEQHLKVYFSEEFAPPPSTESIELIKEQYQLKNEEMILIGATSIDRDYAAKIGVDFFLITPLLEH